MKVRKKTGYTVVINSNIMVVTLTKSDSFWADKMQFLEFGIKIFDCTFSEAVHNLKILSKNYYITLKR